jgi:hypothetical protein
MSRHVTSTATRAALPAARHNTGDAPHGPTAEAQSTVILSHLQESWRISTVDVVQQHLCGLALLLADANSEDAGVVADFRNHLQQGLFRLLQRHYVSYKPQVKGEALYNAFTEKLALWLDLIPLTFPPPAEQHRNSFADEPDEEGVTVLLHLLTSLLDRPQLMEVPLLLPVLQMLQSLSLSEPARAKVLQLTLGHLPRLCDADPSTLPALLAMAGDLPCDALESLQTVGVVRALWGTHVSPTPFVKDDPPEPATRLGPRIARVVTQWLGKEWNGHFLATAWLQTIEEATLASSLEECIHPLDLFVLLALWDDVDFGRSAQSVLSSWVSLPTYFDALQGVISILQCSIEETDDWDIVEFGQEWMPAAIHLVVRLLRLNSTGEGYTQAIHDLCMHLYDALGAGERPAFIRRIIHLWHVVDQERGETSVSPNVYLVLRSLATRAPDAMRFNRHVFVDYLWSHASPAVEDVSAALVSLYHNEEYKELAELVRKLLFSAVDCKNDCRMVNGMLLATEMVRGGRFEKKQIRPLRDWVRHILLPCDRRTVAPKLGSPGLAFLDTCRLEASLNVFDDVQMILANTGLIQRYSSYSQTKRKYTPTLGYIYMPAKGSSANKEAHDFIFCTAFFLRHVGYKEIEDWEPIVRWVFDLVDVYLAHGRRRSRTTWKPQGWLDAVVEFPAIYFPFKLRGPQQKAAAKWLLRDLGAFQLSSPGTTPPPANFRSTCTDIFTRNPSELELFQNNLIRFALGLLVGISLSAAVLKNAFEHYRELTTGDEEESDSTKLEVLRMMETQIMKMYHLRDKLLAMDQVLIPLEGSIRKLETQAKNAMVDTTRKDKNQPTPIDHRVSDTVHSGFLFSIGLTITSFVQSLLASMAQLREMIAKLDESLFSTSVFVNDEILWESLSEDSSTTQVQDHISSLLSTSPPSKRGTASENGSAVATIVESKLRIASQLVDSTSSKLSGHVSESHLERVTTFTLFLVRLLPKLRRVLSDMDAPPLSSWNRLSATCLQLVTLCFEQGRKNTEPSSFCLRMLSRSFVTNESAQDGLVQVLLEADDIHISNGVLDLLSIVCYDPKGFPLKLTEASSSSLRKCYTNSGVPASATELPFALSTAVNSFKAPSKSFQPLRKSLDTTVVRTTNRKGNSLDSFAVYRYALLLHFGLLVQGRSKSEIVEDNLSEMTEQLERILQWMRNKSKKMTRSSAGSSSEKKIARHVSSIPCLTASNFADFFETTIHMVIAALVLFPPTESAASGSPYHHLQTILRIWERLAGLYVDFQSCFPRKSVAAWYSASRQIMDATLVQVDRCSDWRSSQPLPKATATHDLGSLVYLGRLVRVCQTAVRDSLTKVSASWSEDGATQVVAKGKALQGWIDRFGQSLEEVVTTHGLSEEDGAAASPAAWIEKKRRRTLSSRLLEEEDIANDEEDIANDDEDEDYSDKNAPSDDGSGDESFGVAGAWGNGEADMDEDSVESNSLPEITIHRAS